jgi:hypothetical protein
MSLITFILLNNLKGAKDSDEKSDFQNAAKRGILKKIARLTSKMILRIIGDANNEKY